MKFGLNMLLWTDDATDERLLPLFEQIRSLGYDGVELPVFAHDSRKLSQLGRQLDDLGLGRTAVTVRSAEDDPMSRDPAIRRKGIEANKEAVESCRALGATHLVGPYYAALGVFSGRPASADEWGRAVDGMREVAEHAAECNVTLAIEFLNRFETYLLTSAADTVRFLRDVAHPSCRMMYDTFHAHIEEKDPASAIRAGGSDIAHVHISENDRSTPGTGQVQWDATFAALREIGYDQWMVVEAFGLALPALAAATKIWRRMYETEQQLMADALRFMTDRWTAAARQAAA